MRRMNQYELIARYINIVIGNPMEKELYLDLEKQYPLINKHIDKFFKSKEGKERIGYYLHLGIIEIFYKILLQEKIKNEKRI